MVLSRCAVILASCGLTTAAAAQDGYDWGAMIQTEAMGSAIEEAGREGSPRAAKSSTRRGATDAKTRANCARVRGWAAGRVRDARLPRALSLCKQLGY